MIEEILSRAYDVALLAEGVDRNAADLATIPATEESPSSRRAWIEIGAQGRERHMGAGRPPRGGRG